MKRAIDAICALCLLIILSPVLILIAFGVRVALGSPVLFRQRRPGLHGRAFNMIKFRTMLNATDGDGNIASDAKRLTRFGAFLRSSSLDELPELFNVLRGDMSLVGPRPLLLEYLPLYTTDQRRRHEVRPGITGLAQVSGRNLITWEERFSLDVKYVDTYCLSLDIRILAATILKVLRREGIAAEGEATMARFTGSAQ